MFCPQTQNSHPNLVPSTFLTRQGGSPQSNNPCTRLTESDFSNRATAPAPSQLKIQIPMLPTPRIKRSRTMGTPILAPNVFRQQHHPTTNPTKRHRLSRIPRRPSLDRMPSQRRMAIRARVVITTALHPHGNNIQHRVPMAAPRLRIKVKAKHGGPWNTHFALLIMPRTLYMTRSPSQGQIETKASKKRAGRNGQTSRTFLPNASHTRRATCSAVCRISPLLLGGIFPLPVLSAILKNSVSVPTGWMLVTAIRSSQCSTRRASQRLSCAAFVAEYGPNRGNPRRAAADETIMMCPRNLFMGGLPDTGWAFMRLIASAHTAQLPVTLTSKMRRNCSPLYSATGHKSPYPALAITTSRPPSSRPASRTHARLAASSATSTTNGRRFGLPAASSCNLSRRRAPMTTRAPRAAACSAIARPMPLEAPVMATRRPENDD